MHVHSALQVAQAKVTQNRQPGLAAIARWLVELIIASQVKCDIDHDPTSNTATIDCQGTVYYITVTKQ